LLGGEGAKSATLSLTSPGIFKNFQERLGSIWSLPGTTQCPFNQPS
jgi:hypothetical protein